MEGVMILANAFRVFQIRRVETVSLFFPEAETQLEKLIELQLSLSSVTLINCPTVRRILLKLLADALTTSCKNSAKNISIQCLDPWCTDYRTK